MQEPYLHQVAAYSDPIFGAMIVPRISGSEANLQYGLDDSFLELLPHITARFVPSAGEVYMIKMYEEKEILDRARLKYGGDVGIAYAPGWFAAQGEQVELSSAGVFRERRERIREVFLAKGHFAAPELPFVRLYVQADQGDLEVIVRTYDIGWFHHFTISLFVHVSYLSDSPRNFSPPDPHFFMKSKRKAYNTSQEPLPSGVDAYADHIHGHTIVPRITKTEARRQYCLTDCHFRDMRHVITAHSVRTADYVYDVKLRKAYNTYKEPYPPGVDVYIDPKTNVSILPRITLTEATAQYCLLDGHLESLPYIQVHALEAVNGVYKIKMYEERLVLEKARCLYGGDIGIDNARDAFSWQKGGSIDLPPAGAVRERRDRIREKFLQRELFAPSKLPTIQCYIEYGRGDLREVVNALAI
ncbi:hypothetical protein KI688_006739 [Linnemannia hyalina]|uniref:Uncharacterized protein n=1 Tax=Linnemannia hyalina TaxID=64524 RepID=A0A9P8BMS6_9FUNG|nr:hypothetical protein KI688_006739 [Linnemannia hyalina]